MPSDTSSATWRTAVSTRARCTRVASGTDDVAVATSSLPAAPRSRCSRFSGSGRSFESQAVGGQPVARAARIRDERCTASTTTGTPAASATASSSSDRVTLLRSRGVALPHAASSLSARVVHVDRNRDRLAFLSATRLAISFLQLGDAVAVARRRGDHGHAVEPVEREQPLDVLDHPLAPVTRHLVDVVEDDDHDVLVRRPSA